LAAVERIVAQISVWAMPLIVGVVLHELAHGLVAFRLGDSTAARAGRLTLNPIAHVDLFGTVLLPLLLVAAHSPFVFGYAKPVPVNFSRLRHPKRDMVWVAAAGPTTNIGLAVASALALRSSLFLAAFGSAAEVAGTSLFASWLAATLQASVAVNVVLAVFNLLPIPPLDGGRVLVGLLPPRQALALSRVEPFGIPIVLVLLASNALGQVLGPVVHACLQVLL